MTLSLRSTEKTNSATLFLLVFLCSAQTQAQDFIVTTTRDAVDVNLTDGLCETNIPGECSLRAAIQQSNELPGLDRITLPPGVFKLTVTGADEDKAATGDLDILDSLEISGAGIDKTVIDGIQSDRVIDVVSIASNIVIQDLTITGGNVAGLGGGGIVFSGRALSTSNSMNPTLLRNLKIFNNKAVGTNGGGINSHIRLPLILDNVELSQNQASSGGGLYSSQAAVWIKHSKVLNNTASSYGGGIDSEKGVYLLDSLVNNNSSTSSGGGVNAIDFAVIQGAQINANKAGIAGNTASGRGSGGGINLNDVGLAGSSQYFFMGGTEVSGNSATFAGGGINASSLGLNLQGSTLTGLVVKNNSADFSGGGIEAADVSLLHGSVVQANSAVASGGGVNFSQKNVPNITTVIQNSAFVDNRVVNSGIDPAFNSAAGGGLRLLNGNYRLSNSTVSGNSVATQVLGGKSYGGGISVSGQIRNTLDVFFSTVFGNRAIDQGGNISLLTSGPVNVLASIIHSPLAGGNCYSANITSPTKSLGYNIDYDGSCKFNQPTTDVIEAGSVVLPLADNGGGTLTHALSAGSRALAKVPTADCPVGDQRQYRRAGSACDIGAFDGNGTAMIQGKVQFASAIYTVLETAGKVDILLDRVGGTEGELSADILTWPKTARDQDVSTGRPKHYDPTVKRVRWAHGDAVQQHVVIDIVDNAIYEGDKEFYLRILPVESAPVPNAATDATQEALVVIKDNELRNVAFVEFQSASPPPVSEGQKSAFVLVDRTASTDMDVASVNYAVVGGTAVSGKDYRLPAGTLTFERGEHTKPILFEIIDDKVPGPDKTIIIALRATGSLRLGIVNTTTQITIKDAGLTTPTATPTPTPTVTPTPTATPVPTPADKSSGGGGADYIFSIYAFLFYCSQRWMRRRSTTG